MPFSMRDDTARMGYSWQAKLAVTNKLHAVEGTGATISAVHECGDTAGMQVKYG